MEDAEDAVVEEEDGGFGEELVEGEELRRYVGCLFVICVNMMLNGLGKWG